MLLGNSTLIDLSRDTAARRCRAGRKQAVRQAFALAARARGDAQFSVSFRQACVVAEEAYTGDGHRGARVNLGQSFFTST